MKLSEISTWAPKGSNKNEIKELTKELKQRMASLQHKMRAQEKYSLLVVLQGMDASGKDGVVKNVFSKIPAFGISVASFKVPTKKELAHDFLWRIHQESPEKGQIKIFNRSHYEDVLVTRVLGFVDDAQAKKRFGLINNFEASLQDNKTIVLKFYLHLSKEVQEQRLKERMQERDKFYKHSDGDWETRKSWDQYMKYYQECIDHTQEAAPWHIIPVDDKWYKEYLIAKIVVETLEKLDLEYPDLVTELV
ncbi:MAG: polyphosphate kinase [Chitinophagales bacterium]|nr:polyphosphate kinase [Chitinophagales bacterium]